MKMTIELSKLQSHFAGNDWCVFKAYQFEENTVTMELFIPKEISWFKGHFPEQAVLPGVVQSNWACELAQYCFDLENFSKLSNLKFKSMILPEKTLQLKLVYKPEKHSVAFEYSDSTDTFSTGLLIFKSAIS